MASRVTTTTYHRRQSPASLSAAAFCMFLATLFYWLVAFSVPYMKHLYFIKTRADGTKFGTFGWCALGDTVCHHHLGYSWHPEIIDNDHLTGSLFLIPFTAAIGSLAFFSLVHSIRDLRSGACSFFLTLIACFFSFLSFLLAVICFGVAHHRFKKNDLRPHYGGALPLLILGWLLYLVCIPLVIIGWLRERHYRRQQAEVAELPTVQTTPAGRRWFKRG